MKIYYNNNSNNNDNRLTIENNFNKLKQQFYIKAK